MPPWNPFIRLRFSVAGNCVCGGVWQVTSHPLWAFFPLVIKVGSLLFDGDACIKSFHSMFLLQFSLLMLSAQPYLWFLFVHWLLFPYQPWFEDLFWYITQKTPLLEIKWNTPAMFDHVSMQHTTMDLHMLEKNPHSSLQQPPSALFFVKPLNFASTRPLSSRRSMKFLRLSPKLILWQQWSSIRGGRGYDDVNWHGKDDGILNLIETMTLQDSRELLRMMTASCAVRVLKYGKCQHKLPYSPFTPQESLFRCPIWLYRPA